MEQSVGIIIIGDEILKGHVQDTNSHFLCKRLFSLGMKVPQVLVIPDDLEVISEAVKTFSKKYNLVITSGGIGPTHDDITFEAVAKAFGEKTFLHPELAEVIRNFFKNDDLDSPNFKLAQVPTSSRLNYGIDKATGIKSKYPLVSVDNVYIFPGIPSLLEKAFNMHENLFTNPSRAFHVKELYINSDELSITKVLNMADKKFKNNVIIGSYPDMHNSYYKVKLTLESENDESLEAAHEFLKSNLPANCIVDYHVDPIRCGQDIIYQLIEKKSCVISQKTKSAIATIEECLGRYSLDEICIGFNGGKDCTALLHMYHSAVARKYPNNIKPLKTLYICRGNPFPEVELFIGKAVKSYNLDIINIDGPIKDALFQLHAKQPEIKAVLMGTRRSDPHSSHLEEFSPCDADWPPFMRVNPVLDWTYSDIWNFIRQLSLPYCSLYDRGYTSLGSMENTHPNPALRRSNDRGSVVYEEAYKLTDDSSERAGRN